MLVSLVDRDIDVQFFKSRKKARKQMTWELLETNDVDEECMRDENGKLKKKFDSDIDGAGSGCDCRYDKNFASLNNGHEIYTWKICRVDKPYVLVAADASDIPDPDCFDAFDEARHGMLQYLKATKCVDDAVLYDQDGNMREKGECLTGANHYGFDRDSCWFDDWLNCRIFTVPEKTPSSRKEGRGDAEELWNAVGRLVDHMTSGMDTEEALRELSNVGISGDMLLRLGFSEDDIEQFDEENEEGEDLT